MVSGQPILGFFPTGEMAGIGIQITRDAGFIMTKGVN